MDGKDRRSEDPIRSEDMEREGWREDETLLDEQQAEGDTLPESGRDSTTDRQREIRGDGFTMLPPD